VFAVQGKLPPVLQIRSEGPRDAWHFIPSLLGRDSAKDDELEAALKASLEGMVGASEGGAEVITVPDDDDDDDDMKMAIAMSLSAAHTDASAPMTADSDASS